MFLSILKELDAIAGDVDTLDVPGFGLETFSTPLPDRKKLQMDFGVDSACLFKSYVHVEI